MLDLREWLISQVIVFSLWLIMTVMKLVKNVDAVKRHSNICVMYRCAECIVIHLFYFRAAQIND